MKTSISKSAVLKTPIWITLAVGLLILATTATADAPAVEESAPFSGTPLEALAGYLGNWEINGAWLNGTPIWSRNEFTVGIGGNFLVGRTFTKNEKGELYERYLTMFAHDAKSGNFKSHGFTFDGTVTVVDPLEVGGEAGQESITTKWSSGGSDLKQSVQLTSKTSYSWKVWVRETGTQDWTLIMDGVWKRVD